MSDPAILSSVNEDAFTSQESTSIHWIVSRASLLKALSHVQTVVERRHSIPILGNVKLSGKDNNLTLTATDMDIMVSEALVAQIEEPGELTLSAHVLYDIVRKIPDETDIVWRVTPKKSQLSLKAKYAQFMLPFLPASQFPVMDEGSYTHHFVLSSSVFCEMLEKVRCTISTEETRYNLNGVYLHSTQNRQEDKIIRAVSTDGHRLGCMEVECPEGAEAMPAIILPRKTVQELKKLLDDRVDTIEISLSKSKIRFVQGSAILTSKLIDANFPEYENVIPKNNDRILEINAASLAKALDRVATLSTERHRGVRWSITHNSLNLSFVNPETGTAQEELDVIFDAESTEEPFVIGLNARYLLEILANFGQKKVQFHFSTTDASVLVKDKDKEGLLYVVMPMQV